MSTMTPTQPTPPLALPSGADCFPSPESLFRLSVDQYEAMVASGVFTKRDRFYLINGFLVAKMTKKPPHVIACEKTRNALIGIFQAGWRVMVEAPVRIPDSSEPEPDLALARGSVDDYQGRHPEPADVPLIVEVADSSLGDDRTLMLRAYARGGIPLYWIVNLVDGQVEVYSDPIPGGYRSRIDFKPGQDVPVVIDGVELGRIAVADMLP
jgi:Uma2 family endonuclease